MARDPGAMSDRGGAEIFEAGGTYLVVRGQVARLVRPGDGFVGPASALGSILAHAVAEWRPVPDPESVPAIVAGAAADLPDRPEGP